MIHFYYQKFLPFFDVLPDAIENREFVQRVSFEFMKLHKTTAQGTC